MSNAAEASVLAKLKWLTSDERFGSATSKEVRWCTQIVSRIPKHETILTYALRAIEGSIDRLSAGEVQAIYEPLCILLRNENRHPGLTAKGLSVLRSLIFIQEDPDVLAFELVHTHNLFATTLETLVIHLDNSAVCRSALAIMNTVVDVGKKFNLHELLVEDTRILSILTKAVDRHHGSERVACELLTLISEIAEAPVLEERVTEVNILLKSLLELYKALPKMPTLALSLLLSSMDSEVDADYFFLTGPATTKVAVREERGFLIPTLMRVITEIQDHTSVHAALSWCHRMCTVGSRSMKAKLDPIKIVNALQRFQHIPAVATAACTALHHVLDDVIADIVLEENMKLILSCLEKHVECVSSYPTAVTCNLVRKMCYDNVEAQTIFGDLGGVRLLTTVMIVMNSEPNVLMHCSAALLAVCDLPTNCLHFAEEALLDREETPGRCFIDRAICSLRLYYERHILHSLYWGLFKAVSVSPECCNVLYKKGVLSMYEQAVDDGYDMRNLPMLCCAVGWARVSSTNAEQATAHSGNHGVEMLLEITQKFGMMMPSDSAAGGLTELDVFSEAALCILHLAHINIDAKKTFERLLNTSTIVGYRTPEILRIAWDGSNFQVSDRVSDELRKKGSCNKSWLRLWSCSASWFEDGDASDGERMALKLARGDLLGNNCRLLAGLGFGGCFDS